METPPTLPVPDAPSLARTFLTAAQPADESLRVAVSAEQVRKLAKKRITLALVTVPLCLLLGVGVILMSPSLTLVAVLCGFFAYAGVTIALRQRDVARTATGFAVSVRGAQLQAGGRESRKIFTVINRPDYLRLILTEQRVVALWLDNRRNPDASLDLPASLQSRLELCQHLRAAGVPVRREGNTQRVLILLGSIFAWLVLLFIARVVLRLAVVELLVAPLTWVVLGILAAFAWWLSQRGE